MSLVNEGYEIIDMKKKEHTEKLEVKVSPKTGKKYITVSPKNTEWKEGKTKKGDRTLYRKHNHKFVNIGFFKSGHVYITYDGQFVKDHRLKYENDQQIKNDVDNLLATLFVIDN
jgi:hypothetical protein